MTETLTRHKPYGHSFSMPALPLTLTDPMGSPHGEVALILALAPPAPGSLQDQDPN